MASAVFLAVAVSVFHAVVMLSPASQYDLAGAAVATVHLQLEQESLVVSRL